MPSLAELEQWMEEQIPDSLHDLPTRLHATVQAYSAQLYEQLLDLTPSLSQIESSLPSIPFVNAAQAPAAAPPPPTPLVASWIDGIAARLDAVTGTRRRTSVLSGIALAGLTYALVHRSIRIRRARIAHEGQLRIPRSRNGARSDAVVVLGADTPLGQTLSHALASQGFIVMASVSNEQSKQTFDSLVPPSMRGYIKTIVLPSYETQTEHITQFARTINAARQLRWPLTAAGDPYARKGSEVDIVAVVNALSYRSPLDHSIQASSSASAGGAPNRPSSPFKLDVDGLSSELQSRVVTPLATMRALVPLMSGTSSTDAQGSRAPSPAILVSLAHPTGASDVASQALLSGMQAIAQSSAASDGSYPAKRRRASRAFVGANTAAGKQSASVITLEARPSTVSNLFVSLLPHVLGGRAISTVPWSRSIGGSLLAARQDAPWYSLPSRTFSNPFLSERTPSSSTTTPTRAKRASSSASSQSSEIRIARTEEHRTVIQATLKLLVETSLHPHSMHSRYYVRLPAVYLPTPNSVSADEPSASSSLSRSNQDPARASMHIESTVLVRTLHTLSAPFYVISQALSELASVVLPFRPSSGYSGTRNTSNSRPAYGPGPGPASNTHSRSCIRHYDAPGSSTSNAKEQTKGSSASMNTSSSQRRHRPLSTASTGSSDHARSSESENARESGGGASFASGNASSGPPSNHDMSSSGLLSSVPSSAFGDASEEEHYNDSDFIEGTESPVLGGGRSTTGPFASERWQSQSQTSSDASAEATYTHSSSMSDDQDDSGTALGARNAQGTYTLSTDETPHASRFGSETDGLPYGFPSHASMQTAEERPWMGPQEDVAAQDQAGNGTQSPLGQSWVALGQSSTQDQAQS